MRLRVAARSRRFMRGVVMRVKLVLCGRGCREDSIESGRGCVYDRDTLGIENRGDVLQSSTLLRKITVTGKKQSQDDPQVLEIPQTQA
jgi:hypothetical protein